VLLPRPEPGTWFDPLFMHPDYRLRGTVLLGISINLFAAFFCWRGSEQASLGTPSWKSQLGWLAAVAWTAGIIHRLPPPWEPMMITSGMYHYVSEIPLDERNEEGVRAYAVEPYEMLFYEEGLSSVVTVARARRSNNMWLANMGKIDASTRVDMPTQVLVAQLPFMFRPEAQDVVVVGLASGITAGSAALQPGPSIIEVAELEPAIERASRLFDEHNNRPLDDTRVRLIKNDGRNHILLQPPGRYDIVINEPSNPWISGVSNLFTREFWEMGKTKLKPGGVWAQWIQTYSMGPEDLKSLLRTFATVFPHVQLFSTIEEADLVLVGSESPLELTYGKAEKLVLGHAPVGMDLRQVDCGLPADILARWQLDERSILAFTSDVEFNTDDNMRIEYSAPLYLHKDTSEANLRNLLHEGGAATAVPWSSVSGHEQLLALAEAYGRRSDWTRGLMVLKRAEELSPGDPRVAELFTSYQQKLAQELDGDEEEEE
jgi:spermidine synthase